VRSAGVDMALATRAVTERHCRRPALSGSTEHTALLGAGLQDVDVLAGLGGVCEIRT
jgi:hypothetical protein